MLQEGRILLSEQEATAVDALMAQNTGVSVSLTRRDPGESGPVLLHVGEDTYEITDDGSASKVGA